MSSLIANKVKTNMHSVSIKFIIVRIILCSTVQTCITYTTIITTIATRSLLLSAYNLFASKNTNSLNLYSEELKPRLFSLQATRLHIKLIELLLTVACFVFSLIKVFEMVLVPDFAFSRVLLRLCFCIMYTLVAFVNVMLSLPICFVLILLLLVVYF